MVTLFTHLFLLIFLLTATASPEYTRPAPRPLVLRHHSGSDSDPQQVHVSLSGKGYMRVSWITSDKTVQPTVQYGKTRGKYNLSATGETTSYHYLIYKSGQIHHVRIGPLDPGTTYYYRCGGSGPEFHFRTPPSAFSVEFAVAGDLGQTEWTVSTLSHIGARDYDVLLLPGDLSYADMDQPLWDSFGRLVEPYASTRPWMVTQGNHEVETLPVIYRNAFMAYNTRWLMPYRASKSTSNLYYSFEVAGAHIIMLGSYADFYIGSDQYRWLKADVASIDRRRTPWVFALLHAPWYNSNFAHRGEGEAMRVAMEEVLYKARVDAVFTGHVHAYERFTRVYNNKADVCGPVHVTIGDGGNREGLANSFENPRPSISVYREPSFGHARLRVFNSTHAHWSWHRNNDTGSFVADELWLESLASSKACKPIRAPSKSQDEEPKSWS